MLSLHSLRMNSNMFKEIFGMRKMMFLNHKIFILFLFDFKEDETKEKMKVLRIKFIYNSDGDRFEMK